MGSVKQEHLICALPLPEQKALTEALQKKYPNLKISYYEVGFKWNHDLLPDDVYKDATILATLSALPSTPKAFPNIGFVQVFGTGTNHLEGSPIFTDSDVVFCNSSGMQAPPIAEWVVMTMLVHSRAYNQLHTLQERRGWVGLNIQAEFTRDISDRVGKRVGVLGYGSIGRQVARVAKAMGMDIIACTATPRTTPESRRDNGYIVPGTGDPDGTIPSAWHSSRDKTSLHDFLDQDLDYLIVSVPLTKATRGLIGEDEFKILGKRHTFVSNVARGDVLDQDALIRSLKAYKESDGKEGICGAAVDVASPEPLPAQSELWDAPNIIITPHISGVFNTYLSRGFDILAANVGRHIEGKPLLNKINKDKGYPSKGIEL